MRAKVAVVTVKGKPYYIIVKELRRRGIPFISLIPGIPVPAEIRLVITTEQEKHKVNHAKTLLYDAETDPEIMGSQVVKILQGKTAYETVVIGVDPGAVFGVAAIADGAVIETENCFNPKQVADRIKGILKAIELSSTAVTVKIGNGVPVYKKVIEKLDNALPPQVILEIVGEAGTNRINHQAKRGRSIRHILSAIRIASRTGRTYHRRIAIEQNS